MSHEIRTPMNGVIGITDALLDTPLDARQLEYVHMIRSSGDSLLAVVNDILDISKIDAGRLSVESTALNIADLVEEVCAPFAHPARVKGLELDVMIDPALDRALLGDPLRIRQILVNMLGNALKFTSAGQVTVSVTNEGHYVRFEVRDTGPGVDPARRDAIFDEFSQADASTSRTFGGTGLGLAISKRLAEAMGGSIGLTGGPGRGSTFWFTVELVEEASPPDPDRLGLVGRRAITVLGGKPGFTTLDRQLQSWGMEVVTAGPLNLDDVLRTVDGRRLEVVVVDEGPECPRPLELMADIRRRWPLLPVLALRAGAADGPQPEDERTVQLVKPARRAAVYNALIALLVDSEHPAPEERRPAGPAPKPTNGVRLLLAEDNHINQVVAVAMLGKLGYTVDVAQNGREAVEMRARQDYAAVLMDCQMPEMDGYEAAQEIRRAENGGPRTPIIALTAHSMIADRDRCLAAGMDDYISKPVRLPQLEATVARWASPAQSSPR